MAKNNFGYSVFVVPEIIIISDPLYRKLLSAALQIPLTEARPSGLILHQSSSTNTDISVSKSIYTGTSNPKLFRPMRITSVISYRDICPYLAPRYRMILSNENGGGYMRLRDLREDNDLTQRELAEKLHISQNTYSQYENGVRQLPIETLIRLSKLYNVSTDYILRLTDNPKRN